jgi:hypothetical protein
MVATSEPLTNVRVVTNVQSSQFRAGEAREQSGVDADLHKKKASSPDGSLPARP